MTNEEKLVNITKNVIPDEYYKRCGCGDCNDALTSAMRILNDLAPNNCPVTLIRISNAMSFLSDGIYSTHLMDRGKVPDMDTAMAHAYLFSEAQENSCMTPDNEERVTQFLTSGEIL